MRHYLSALVLLIASLGPPTTLAAQSESPFHESSLRVTLDFRDQPLREVLEELSRIAGVNMVLSATVSGRVTAKFDGVPIGDAFESLLAAGGVAWSATGDLVTVGP